MEREERRREDESDELGALIAKRRVGPVGCVGERLTSLVEREVGREEQRVVLDRRGGGHDGLRKKERRGEEEAR